MLSFQIKPWVAFGLTYLLIELFYIGIPEVWTDGRSIARSMYGHVITKFYRMGRLPQLLSYGAPRLELRYHYGKLQNDYLYKTILSRRLLRFHQPVDVVYAQTMESSLSRFLNLHGATIS